MHLDGSITPLHKEDLTLEPVNISAIAELQIEVDEEEFVVNGSTDEIEISSKALSDDDSPNIQSGNDLDFDLDV